MQVDPLLSLRQCALRLGDYTLLHESDLDVVAGGPTVLLGPNGSGKTSLLKLMMGLIAPSQGSVIRRTKRCAFVFQKPVMLRRTAAANIAFARRAAGLSCDRSTVEKLLRDVGLDALHAQPARKLSGGEQQRLALARALALEPDILFLDEPTASLDVAQTRIVEDLIRHICARGVKIVMSTHDLGQARRLAEDVIFLLAGQVREQGSAQGFFHQPQSQQAQRFLAGELVGL